MIHQCRCGFATDDQLWFESHQARHILKGDHDRDHDVSGLTVSQLERARGDLLVSLSLAFPGSPVRAPILAQISAIDAELTQRVDVRPEQLPSSRSPLSPWRGSARRVEDDAPVFARRPGIVVFPPVCCSRTPGPGSSRTASSDLRRSPRRRRGC